MSRDDATPPTVPDDGEPAASQASPGDEEADADMGRGTTAFGNAVSWSFVLTSGRTFMTLVVSLVLARILGPEAFGLIAMANVFILFAELFVRQGLVAAIVQRPKLTAAHLDTAFWMTVMLAAVLVPVVIGASGWWAAANDTPELAGLITALVPLLVFKALGVAQEAHIRRQMDFRALALRTNVAVLTGGAAGITAALLGAGVWSLVIQQLVTAFLELVLIWLLSSWRPRWRFRTDAARDLISFAARMVLAALGSFVNTQSDALLIGLFFGPLVVGLYRMAVRFISIMLELTSGTLQLVMLPELSRFSEDRSAFNARTVEVIRLASLIAVPVLGVLAASSDALMGLLGEEWAPAADALKVLCILAVVQAAATFLAPILQAAGRPGLLAWLTWISAGLSAGSFAAAGLWLVGFDVAEQVLWLAIIRTAVFVPTLFLIVLPMLNRALGLKPGRVIGAMWRAPIAAATGYAAFVLVRTAAGTSWPQLPLLDLLLSATVSGTIILVVLLTIEPLVRQVPALIRERVARRSATRADSSALPASETRPDAQVTTDT